MRDSASSLAGFGQPYWLDLPRPDYPVLERDLAADAVVIGAGIFGLKLARYLGRLGLQVVILEASRVGEGASGRNQGSANHGAGIDYLTAIDRYGRARAREIWQLGLENHRLIREQLDDYEVDCDYRVGGFTFLARRDMPGWEEDVHRYRMQHDLLAEDGFAVGSLDAAEALRRTGNPVFAGGLTYRDDAQFHSGKYVIGLARGVSRTRGVQLYERTRVTAIERTGAVSVVRAGAVAVRAPLVFLALNALAPQQVRGLAPGLRAERGQVLVTEPLPDRPCHGSFGTAMAWWRELPEADGRFRLLFGGGRRRDEPDSLFRQFTAEGQPHPSLESGGFSPSEAHQARLDAQFATLFPRYRGVAVTHRWGGLQSFTADGFPQVGLFDAERAIYGAAGFSGRGNCYSDVAAAYLVGLATGTSGVLAPRHAALIAELMAVGRPGSQWGDWDSNAAAEPPEPKAGQ